MIRRAAVGAALAVLLAGTSLGQRLPGEGDRDIVRSRERGNAHPGQPLRVVGIGDTAEGNDLRAGLHAARRGEYAPAQVDQDQAYARRLALFESDARVDQAPSTFAPPRERAKAAPQAPATEPTDDARPSTDWVGYVLAGAAAVALALGAKRAR